MVWVSGDRKISRNSGEPQAVLMRGANRHQFNLKSVRNRSLPSRGGTSGLRPQPFLPGGLWMVTSVQPQQWL